MAGAATLEQGKTAPGRLVEVFRTMYSDTAAQHAFEILRERTPLARALTGDPAVDAWRAWIDAREALARGRPWDAYERVGRLRGLHTGDGASLVDLELDAIVAECLAQANQPGGAIAAWDDVRGGTLALVERAAEAPEPVAAELRAGLNELVGVDQLDVSHADVVGAWGLGHGLSLLLDASLHAVRLLGGVRAGEDARAVADGIEREVAAFHESLGYAFGREQLEGVEFALGDAWTELDPARALGHFERAGGSTGANLTAAVNAANCLTRLGRFDEARARYAALESAFEHAGDYLGAARVWAAECVAAWKGEGDPEIRHSLVGAIKMFEDSIPATADRRTLYTLKRYNEAAYLLLVTVIAAGEDRSDARLDELVSALWALQQPDIRAELEPDEPEPGWPAILVRQQRPLEIVKAMMRPFRSTGAVHVCSGTDALVFVVYGYDGEGRFRFEMSLASEQAVESLTHFLELMDEQLAADLRRDQMQLAQLDKELVVLGDSLAGELAPGFVEVLGAMEHLYYMANPYGSIEQFPLGGLRLGGAWLATTATITRTPTPSHLRETLSATRPEARRSPLARVLSGDPAAGPAALTQLEVEVEQATHVLGVLGFDTEAVPDAGVTAMVDLLDGGAGVVHYIGHGIANEAYEGLPLASGEILRPAALGRLPGFTTGFVFISACEAARVRHGMGGYQSGVASRLVERGAPGVLAFTHPVLESRAGGISLSFYRAARRLPFGEAVRAAQTELATSEPAYTWLSLAAYGDPDLVIPALAGEEAVRLSSARARTWDSDYRSFVVLRTDEALARARAAFESAPAALRDPAAELLDAFAETPRISAERLGRLEAELLDAGAEPTPSELLTLRAAVVLGRAHLIGLDVFPLAFPEPGEPTRELFHDLIILAKIGAALFDTRLNGLAQALLGRLLVWDQGALAPASEPITQALEKLEEAVGVSPFLARIREETIGIVRQFGGTPLSR